MSSTGNRNLYKNEMPTYAIVFKLMHLCLPPPPPPKKKNIYIYIYIVSSIFNYSKLSLNIIIERNTPLIFYFYFYFSGHGDCIRISSRSSSCHGNRTGSKVEFISSEFLFIIEDCVRNYKFKVMHLILHFCLYGSKRYNLDCTCLTFQGP